MSVYDRLDRAVLRGEAHLGRAGFAVLASLLWMGVAALCVRPGTRAVELGVYYAQLSVDPLGFHPSPVGYRILTPLLSWAVGLRGEAILWTNLALATLLLFLVQLHFRRTAPRPADAPLAAGTLALSLVTLSTVFSPTYCDPATYLAVFGMWWARRRPAVFHVCLLLGLLNRESILFLLPWFGWLVWREGGSWRAHAVGLVLVLGVYGGFRAFVASQSEVVFGLDYYLAPLREDPLQIFRRTWGRQWLGLYSVFGVLWAVPLGAALAMARRGDRAGLAGLVLVVACTWAQLFVAYDTSRMFTLAFPVMLLALSDIHARDDLGLRRWLPALLVLQAIVPMVRTAQQRVWTMESPWRDALLGALGF
ncbi:MAG: hypothetical protein ACQGVC_10110 [Myxococcota bacterium]